MKCLHGLAYAASKEITKEGCEKQLEKIKEVNEIAYWILMGLSTSWWLLVQWTNPIMGMSHQILQKSPTMCAEGRQGPHCVWHIPRVLQETCLPVWREGGVYCWVQWQLCAPKNTEKINGTIWEEKLWLDASHMSQKAATAMGLKVEQLFTKSGGEMRSLNRVYLINNPAERAKGCTCREYFHTGLPCVHIAWLVNIWRGHQQLHIQEIHCWCCKNNIHSKGIIIFWWLTQRDKTLTHIWRATASSQVHVKAGTKKDDSGENEEEGKGNENNTGTDTDKSPSDEEEETKWKKKG